ncbi:hypothetical protein D3C76_1587170 [compost metagenome]
MDRIDEPSSIPSATPARLPSLSIPASIPAKASKLIWYTADMSARLKISPVMTPTDAPRGAPPTSAKIRIK